MTNIIKLTDSQLKVLAAAAERVLSSIGQGKASPAGDDLRLLEEKVSAKLEVSSQSIVSAAAAFTAAIANTVRSGDADSLERPAQGPPQAVRHRLPEERASLTHKFSIAGHEGYITVGLYPNGKPGEIFIRMAKEGSTVSGLMDSFATAISLALQHGVPLKVLVDKFAHTRFEPSGWTGSEQIGYAKSIMDYIFRWLQLRFLSGQQLSLFAGMGAGVAGSALPAASAEAGDAGAGSDLEAHGPDWTAASDAGRRSPGEGILPGAPSSGGGPETGQSSLNLEDRGIYGGATQRGSAVFHAADAMKEYLDMGDAPSCHTCGAIMVRNGSCYRCMSCGSTSGCS